MKREVRTKKQVVVLSVILILLGLFIVVVLLCYKAKEEDNSYFTDTSNQGKMESTDIKGDISNNYILLDKGEIGCMTATNQKTGLYDEIFIRISSFNDEQTTNSLIEEYIKSGNSYFKDTNAPLGTHWESVTYGIKYDSENSYYVNVQLVGLDGEKLNHRGVSYSKRSYDIDNKTYAGEDGWIEGYVAFFAVPNGCTEYAVACGDSVGTYGYKAYYKDD